MRTTSVLVCLLLVAPAAPARATVVVPADLGELARDAIAIARGRVAAVHAQWTDDRGTIETIVTLDVESYLKGSFGSVLRFRVPGGELGRFRSIVVGAPEFVVDQRVVVFLGARAPAMPFIVGFNQGVFRVVAGESGWIVTPPANLPAAANVRVVRGDAARRPLPLADFELRVRTLAGSAR